MNQYLPEGFLIGTAENAAYLKSADSLLECKEKKKILEARCVVCDNQHNLIVDLPCMRGIIPREEGAVGISEGITKDIALISRVNKPVCFTVTGIGSDCHGEYALLSRREAQEMCSRDYISTLLPGDVINARVTHLEQFGCFVDIGCGIPSLIPIDLISVSRISHPSDRFYVGQDIRAVVKSFDSGIPGRICLTHKELLGTWQQNADCFSAGETVTGIIRSIENYGIFVELSPNLAGLAEPHAGVAVNQKASVFIKAIIPEKLKIKLVIVDSFDDEFQPDELKYFVNEPHIDRWIYSEGAALKHIETVF